MHTRTLFVLLLVGILFSSGVAVVSAHDTETVAGYEVTFGGAEEPVVTDERTWLEVQFVDAETEEPVEDLADSLTIAVRRPFGDDVRELEVESRFGEPGWYEAQVVFTEPGTYTVFVNGTVDGAGVNLEFQKQVHDASDLEYPPESASDGLLGSLAGGVSAFVVGVAVAGLGMVAAFAAGRRF